MNKLMKIEDEFPGGNAIGRSPNVEYYEYGTDGPSSIPFVIIVILFCLLVYMVMA